MIRLVSLTGLFSLVSVGCNTIEYELGCAVRGCDAPPVTVVQVENPESCSLEGNVLTCGETILVINNGQDGQDGIDGIDGQDGQDGIDGKDGRDGIDGKDGVDGQDGQDGQDGIDGQDGKDGIDGQDGQDGAKGEQGEKGEKGDKGDAGDDAPAGPFSITELIDPCGPTPGKHDEVLFKLADGSVAALYYDHAGKKSFLTKLLPGTFVTTDFQSCVFTINPDMSVTW
jgi:hypothetical protein